MKNNTANVGLGLISLFVSIPAPTVIHGQFNQLVSEGYIILLQTYFQGIEAQLLLILMSIANLGLFAIAVYALGRYLTELMENSSVLDK